ncbi:DMT family transporter [Loktanella sp. 3ANDIMAR09]|uniref:DMT family transporter n=1 Tax=Loktanella sp. 3ANDIMAR09 TaxID=1225657 RepID=UPI0034615E32
MLRLISLVTLVMVAFAANSILNRVAVAGHDMAPMTFAAMRVAAGAAVLLACARRDLLRVSPARLGGAVTLAVYMIGFSWAYLALDAGLGALILFGCVQLGMFAYAVARGAVVPVMRWVGAGVALAGLAVLLWPAGGVQVPVLPAIAMVAAGLGWAGYTLLGQGAADPVAASAVNFVLCLPLVILALMVSGQIGTLTAPAILAAVTSGAVTSGLGYALWYRVLPQLPTTVAAIAQLSVPVIAVAGGVVLLGEPLTQRLVIAAGLVLGGIALSLYRKSGSSGS